MTFIHQEPIQAHGGRLKDRYLPKNESEFWFQQKEDLDSITLTSRQRSDLLMIASGAYSPLDGFLGKEDHRSVLDRMRLTDGTLWPIPITLSVSEREADNLEPDGPVAMKDQNGDFLGILHLEERYRIDREKHARKVFKTTDRDHPGVRALPNAGDITLGGKVDVLHREDWGVFDHQRMTPVETRQYFDDNDWNRIVAFQTRNPMHRAHEYLVKCALENTDGLLLHPIVGDTKDSDIPASVRLECYKALFERYLPQDRVLLSVMPAKMNYAGPREAVLHALIRQNYGCTHFIVGRDHAGVGDYYGTYEAQKIFSEIESNDLMIEPVFFEYAFWCEECDSIASEKTCPHDPKNHLYLSGTQVRERLKNGDSLPREFSRPEVAEILKEAYTSEGSAVSS